MLYNPFIHVRLDEPKLRFRYNLHQHPRIGLYKYGPYSAYRIREINIKIITERHLDNSIRELIRRLTKGYGRYKGFKETFYLTEEVNINDSDYYSIIVNDENEIEQMYFQVAEEFSSKIGVIVFALRDYLINKFYAKLKALRFKYTANIVRVQLLKESVLRKALLDPLSMEYILWNLSTAIYTKCNGIPWVHYGSILPAGIFIGIAFTKPKLTKEYTSSKEIFCYGVMTIYNKYGIHIDTRVTPIMLQIPKNRPLPKTKGLFIPYNDMKNLLREIINRYNPPIVIIHKSARFHEDEKKAIDHILGNRDIDYVLIHIEGFNPYRGFTNSQLKFTVIRGDLILDREKPNRSILFTTGCTAIESEIKLRKRPGTPRAIELEIEKNMSSFNAETLAQQVLALTKLDWNTTDIEIRMPVTIKYARKASLLASALQVRTIDIRDLM